MSNNTKFEKWHSKNYDKPGGLKLEDAFKAGQESCEHEWISVDDRLPETNNDQVLVFWNEGNMYVMKSGRVQNNTRKKTGGQLPYVTHWQPEPKPLEDE